MDRMDQKKVESTKKSFRLPGGVGSLSASIPVAKVFLIPPASCHHWVPNTQNSPNECQREEKDDAKYKEWMVDEEGTANG